MILISIALLTLMMLAPLVSAQTEGGAATGRRSQRRAMMQERIAACANKSAGDPCTFSRGGKDVSGACRPMRRGKLVCRSGGKWKGGGAGGEMGGASPHGN